MWSHPTFKWFKDSLTEEQLKSYNDASMHEQEKMYIRWLHDYQAKLCLEIDTLKFKKSWKTFGNKKDGVILQINESKLNQDYIDQIRNYLNVMENG